MTGRAGHITVVIAGGGTGGHLYPGIAVAEALQVERPDAEITFVGTGRDVERRVLAGRPYEYKVLRTPRLERSLHPKNLLLPFRLVAAVLRARRLLKKSKANLVIGTGGYGSAPVVMAARLRRKPAVILEQNIIPGVTNRILSRFADVACLTFKPSESWLGGRIKTVVTGNPIRVPEGRPSEKEARDRLGLAPDRFTVFVFGGSQGALTLTRAAQGSLSLLNNLDAQMIVQTGGSAEVKAPPGWKDRLLVGEYFDNIYDCYAAADLVVCRAGGGVSEVLAFGRPMVLVPYPYAAHGHQERNAVYVEQEGAAVVVDDGDMDGTKLAALVNYYFHERDELDVMARAARELGRPEAAKRAARVALSLVKDE
ncbi:MAG: undecaprenyldiphospho-muramoylpentapeptide beta-N-acetylglucosaminyltransferase [Candidatus Coatesbacteria bacterium]|nr:MAG: undecaprenyldiphospho-muramoylpentapeptide beta-N-acetylglucosaminyltransferase [Candidatus Coatesbacteria bacterium]